MIFYNKILRSPNQFDPGGGGGTPSIAQGADFNVQLVETVALYNNIATKNPATAYFIPEIQKIIVDNIAYGFSEDDLTASMISSFLSGGTTNTAVVNFTLDGSGNIIASVGVRVSSSGSAGDEVWSGVSEQDYIHTYQDGAISSEANFLTFLGTISETYSIGDVVRGSVGGVVKDYEQTLESSGIVATVADTLFADYAAFETYLEANTDYYASNFNLGDVVRGYTTGTFAPLYAKVIDNATYYYAELTGYTTASDNLISVESDGLFVDSGVIQGLIDDSTGITFTGTNTVKAYVDSEVANVQSDVDDVIDAILGSGTGGAFDPGTDELVTIHYLIDSGTSKIKATLLPSYVDDVIEVADYASLPATGETGKIYVTIDDNVSYRWSGSAYFELSNPNLISFNDSDGNSYDLVSDDLYVKTINGNSILDTSSGDLSICQWTVTTT
jgi:hypothetical protein